MRFRWQWLQWESCNIAMDGYAHTRVYLRKFSKAPQNPAVKLK